MAAIAKFLDADTVPAITTFVNADGTNAKTIFTANANGSYVYEIAINSNDTAAKDITLLRNNGEVDEVIKLSTVAINQGNVISSPDPLRLINTITGFIVLRMLDRDQNYYIPMPAGTSLKMKVNAAVTATKTITAVVQAKNF